MQSHTGPNPMNHFGADCWVMDICADVDSSEDSHDVEGESVTHGIYPVYRQPPYQKEEGIEQAPMNISGTNFETASHARYIDPRLCPSRVNAGHVASSTRYLEFRNTKCSDFEESLMPNLD